VNANRIRPQLMQMNLQKLQKTKRIRLLLLLQQADSMVD
jgi:hypothetical protein